MTKDELAYRMLSAHSAQALSSFKVGDITEHNQAKLKEVARSIADWPFYIDDTPGIDISVLKARARHWKRKHNIQWLMVDFLQLVQSSEYHKANNRVNEVGNVARSIKNLAAELQIPIIILAQLNRDVKDEVPDLHHLKDSSAIEESSDVVFLLHELKDEARDDGRLRQYILKLAKQRNGPSNIDIQITYQAWRTLFTKHEDPNP
jgi:replicative DNA helicase